MTVPRRLDDVLDAAPCGFLSFTDDGIVTLANRTLLGNLGYAADTVVGRHVEALLTIPGRIFYQTHFFPLIRLHGKAEEIFLLLRTADGRECGYLVNAVRHERDGVVVNDCVLLEVRERRKYEDELLRAKKAAERAHAEAEARSRELAQANQVLESQAMELELQQQQLQEQADELDRQRATADEANRAKSSFLAVMSHELRTPLNAIAGYVQLVLLGIHGPVTDQQRDALERVVRSQRHLLRLINDVLNLSRIEAGRVEYTIEDVPLAELVASVMPMIEPQLGAKDLTYEVAVPADLSARADREKLQQILLNVLTNAVKFTPRGGHLRVDTALRGGQPALLFLRVSDTGIGIPSSKIERIFEPFVQVDMSHSSRNEGTGLGLAISRDLARGMGGDLRARSEEGHGSTFTLALPRSAAD